MLEAEISSGKCPCELCSTNGLAMEKELYIESVGDAGSSGASKSCICVLKPPATYEWLTPTDPARHQRKGKYRGVLVSGDITASLIHLFPSWPPLAHWGRFFFVIKAFNTTLARLPVSGGLITLTKTHHLRLTNLPGHCSQPVLCMLPGSSPFSLTLSL